MQKIVILLFFALSASVFGQDYLNKTEKYDVELFNYLDSLTVEKKVPLEEYLKFSKPFSKWDIRPLHHERIYALDSVRTSSEISNFFWGGFSQRYELTEKEAADKPNQFLKQGMINEDRHIQFLKDHLPEFKTLAALVGKSRNLIYVNQSSLQRVDGIFKENNGYWSYVIPQKSPFPISAKIKAEGNYRFSSLQQQILEQMKKVNIYSIVKTDLGMFFVLDGFSDNSYGYYFSSSGMLENNNHLFEIMSSRNISDGFYYYIAN
ncbi:hypothetical protein [uncultured Chryseobacterium sp.]|uniref:hypothetical protein n=1 Tax=uncultured Chryseobacterium sp. TaxID=259322 RepID=UPI002582F912|nr:hypothetical protein [uncultured Chryseobacterium sp.]